MIRTALALLAAFLVAAPAPEASTLIRGAHVFDGAGSPAQVRDVLIRDGRIAAVERDINPPLGARVIDAAGMTLLPGLHDLHIHTRSQVFENADTLARGFAPYVASGVTSINEYSVNREMLPRIRAIVAGGRVDAPHLQLALRMGVPHGHGTESDFTNSITAQVTTPDEARAAMAALLPHRPDVIKVFTDGWRYGRDEDRPNMDLPTLSAIVEAAKRAHVPVVTHTVTADGARIAAQAGVDAMVHGIGDTLVDHALVQLMKRRGLAYVPTLVVYEPQQDREFLPQEWKLVRPRGKAREAERDAKPVAPIPTYESRRWRIMQENVRRLKAAGVRIGVGTDAGIGGVYHGWATIREIRWLVKLGFTPAEALKAATSESALIIGKGDIQGRIAPGLNADLLLVGGRPDQRIEDLYDVRHVFVGGRELSLPAARAALAADAP
ncbi:hypothetical protein D1610_02800 [Sphingomonas gilva]|uniref:Amidohydrolase-related domain-containing protein n=1 Tax=Sphingomonas gilva TaxID=2305907 RepID=A0A396RRN8_9SPHN|nr:amidohydrolase family protein [Sphingomonas gilva]RHW19069.1 hypothetical protein D1610_02800 [Sphingomonas gilva]